MEYHGWLAIMSTQYNYNVFFKIYMSLDDDPNDFVFRS